MASLRRFIQKINNLRIWFKVIFNDKQWDHYFLFLILEKKLELMERSSYDWQSVGCEKDTKQIKIARILCNRIAKEEVYWKKNRVFPNKTWSYYSAQRDDLNYLCEILKKHSLYWWD